MTEEELATVDVPAGVLETPFQYVPSDPLSDTSLSVNEDQIVAPGTSRERPGIMMNDEIVTPPPTVFVDKSQQKKARVKGSYTTGEENFHRIQLQKQSVAVDSAYKKVKTKESKLRIRETRLRILMLENRLTEDNVKIPESESDSDEMNMNDNLM